MHHVLGRSLRVEQFLPSAFSGPGLRGLGGVEVSTSPEPPARRPAPQPRASPPPAAARLVRAVGGASGCMSPTTADRKFLGGQEGRTPAHAPTTRTGHGIRRPRVGRCERRVARRRGLGGRGWAVLDLDDENRRKSLKWSACPAATTPQLREAFTYLFPPSFGPCGWSRDPVARR
jgi:hypothetical protein